MMQEIWQNGPIACGIAIPSDLYDYTEGIYCDKTGDTVLVHDVEVVGYDITDDGQKYWIVKNSWGTQWGEHGYLRVCRGWNNIGIESDCSMGTPKDTWSTNLKHITTVEEQNDPNNDRNIYDFP